MSHGPWLSLSAALCAGVGALTIVGWWSQWDGWRRLARVGGVLGVAAAAALWVARFVEVGHLPLFGTFEAGLSLALCVLGVAAVLELSFPDGVGGMPVALMTAAAVLIHAGRYSRATWALTISERSVWAELHGIAAWLAFGLFASSFAYAVRVLVRADGGADARWLPRLLHWGFVLQSTMMALGSFYKFLLFGRTWSFDPIESLAVVAWASYATIIHLRYFAGWRGEKLAAWAVLGFLLLVLSYKGVLYFPSWSTYHILDVDLRLHIPG
ncbi:MAG: cytochrome c biogenesis protein CcsA [Deltaproteobacteria bacterium]|nr:cytochrome c biogenesis protein CcsA [Deltaproteobacteria bacterium]